VIEPRREETPQTVMPSVAIISPDRRVRDGLTKLLGVSGRARVVGAVADAEAAFALVTDGTVDALVLDMALSSEPDRVGLLAALRERAPGARILLIAWDGPPLPLPGERFDGILDVAGHPARLVDAIVGGTRPAEAEAI
jgi:DNA-binding NtrC family response regulator